MGSVLYIAAHPDDENTQVITYLARGRGYRTAYLSLTRGDGGQNLLGPQFGEQLGVARTQELLAARRLDGGRQYFTRAKDFGYLEGLPGDAADLGPAGRPRRHRPRDPLVPAGRDRDAVLSAAGAHTRPSHRLRRPRRRSLQARRRPAGISRTARRADPVATQTHSPQRRRRRGGSRRRRRQRDRRGEDGRRRQRPGVWANRLPRSPPAAGPCTRRRASAWARLAVAGGSRTETFRAARWRARHAGSSSTEWTRRGTACRVALRSDD